MHCPVPDTPRVEAHPLRKRHVSTALRLDTILLILRLKYSLSFPIDMSGESRSLSPAGNHPDSQPPAKRQRLGEVPSNKSSTTVLSPKSPEAQNCVSYIDDLGLDCQQELLPKSTVDRSGFDKALSKQDSTGLQSGYDELLPEAICNSSSFEELGSPCLLGEALTQFCPDTELSSSPIQQLWPTYVEAYTICDGDSLLTIAGDPLDQNKDVQHPVTTRTSSAELFLLQGLKGHNTEDVFSTSELKESANNGEDENVCFGMVSSVSHLATIHLLIVQVQIKATYDRLGPGKLPESFSVSLDRSSRFSSKEYDFIRGRIQPEQSRMLQGLLEEESLKIYVVCIAGDRMPSKKGRSAAPQPCSLELSVYGPKDLFDDIGSWFQDYEIYLQDPRICHLEAKYHNPQRLSSDDISASPLVSEVVIRTLVLMPKEVPECHDFLELLSSYVDLEETPQPSAIRATLKR
jgi:hypothetical protein